jgi:hypothetical protein
MNHDKSIRYSTKQGRRYGHVCGLGAVVVTVSLVAAISFGEFVGQPSEALVTALPVDATARSFVSRDEPATLVNIGFPVECSQVPSGLDCLYY